MPNTPDEREEIKEREERESMDRQELTDAIERLNKNVDRVAVSTTKTADKISKATDRITKVVASTDELGKASLRLTATGLAVAGTGATLVAAQRTGNLGRLAKTSAALTGVFGGAALGGGKRGALGTALKVVGLLANLHPALKALAVAVGVFATVRGLRGSRSAGDQQLPAIELKKQTKILSELLSSSNRMNRGLFSIQAIALANADPLNRGAGFAARRIGLLGGAVTPGQALTAALETESQTELAISQAALKRTGFAFAAEARTTLNEIKTSFNVFRTGVANFLTLEQGPRGFGTVRQRLPSDRTTPTTQVGTFIRLFISNLTGVQNNVNGIRGQLIRADRERRFGGDLGGENNRNLARLRFQGPQQILTPSPTVRAGGESEYQFRVQRQRFALQQEITRRWQDSVLRLLEALVKEGDVSNDALFLQRLQFGRDPGVE